MMRRVVDLLLICSFFHPYFYCTGHLFDFNCQKPNWFQCDNGRCMAFTMECDGEDDCGDNSDEKNCENFKLQVPASIQCATDEFRCEDSDCIPKEKFCDAVRDCADGSDEYVGCVEKLDCKGKYRCADKHCVTRSWVCDGINDCPDSSDELNCDNRIFNASECTSRNDRYLCKNQRCIPLSVACDNKNNCGDGSDEGVGCTNSTTSCASLGCNDICRKTPDGPVCVCRAGYTLQENRTCTDIDECTVYGICDQQCVNTRGSYKCTCQANYTLLADKKTCRADGGEATLIYSTTAEIRGIHLSSEMYFIILQNLSHVVGIAAHKHHYYWSELAMGSEAIVRSTFGGKKEVLVSTGLDLITDVAVDWITGNIYFTDEGYMRIGVCDNNGTYCTVLINKQSNMLTGIALLPTNGLMYWSDWNTSPHISVAGMDGQNSRLFVTKNLEWPVSVTIDYPSSRLYWVDAKLAVVESIRLDGTDRRIILRDVIQHPFSLAVFENKLYWSDWTEKTIQSCNKFSGKDWKIVTRTSNTPHGVHIEHSALKPKISNPCLSNPCSHLCILNENTSYTCACTLGMELSVNKRTCRDIQKKHHIVIASAGVFIDYYHELLGKPNVTANVANRHVTVVTYDSLTGLIFANDNFNNGIIRYDPVHGSSETFTYLGSKLLGGMAFDNIGNNLYLSDKLRKTIEVHSMPTNTSTTFYFEEEPREIAVAPQEGVMFVVFRSKDRYRIDKMQMSGFGAITTFVDNLSGPKVSLYYDKEEKKLFWSDQGSGHIESANITGFGRYVFRTGLKEPIGLTIADNYVFWTERNSNELFWTDKSDMIQRNKRVLLRTVNLAETAYLVTLSGITVHENVGCHNDNGNCSHVCLPSSETSYICACPDGLMLSANNRTCIPQTACPPGKIKCSEHDICIKRQQWCDGIKDCPNGEDEPSGCKESGHCGENKFMCKNGQCIDIKGRCNSQFDCADKSDENDCKTIPCRKGEFQCHEGDCISSFLVCNGKFDCPDTSDELNCKSHECSSDQFMCGTKKCIPAAWKCDGQIDCPDGSDENVEICKPDTCDDQQFRCNDGRCISSSLKCDGISDCNDESDEQYCPILKKSGHIGNCSDDEYSCYNTDICIPKRMRCNGVQDCPKNDDEHKCAYCSENEFACENLKCIPLTWICDKTDDCGDKSDEKDCGSSTWRSKITKQNACEEFTCLTGETCLPFSKVCNGIQDCLDGSDERGKCTTSCAQNNRCHGLCNKTPQGGVCSCVKGYRLAADQVSCDDINECESDVCAQLCHNTVGSFACSCFDGYIIRDDKIACKIDGPPMELIISTDRDIRKIPSNTRAIQIIHSLSGSTVDGLDMNIVDNAIYWSNGEMGTINKLNVETKELKFVKGVGNPKTLSVDGITSNIYFNNIDQPSTIKVCNLEQEKCATIVKINGAKISSLVVTPMHRLLFWSETNWFRSAFNKPTSEIYRSNMMGSDIKMIVSRNMSVVTGMAIDYTKAKLYWTDSVSRTIESSNLNGTQRSTFLRTFTHQPTSISIHENSLWVMTLNGELQKCKLFDDKSCESVNLGPSSIYRHFTIRYVFNQPRAENPCKSLKCNHMCVLTDEGPTCICGDGKPVKPNNICTLTNTAIFAVNNTDLRSISIRNSGNSFIEIFIGFILFVLIISVYHFYQQRNKLKPPAQNNVSIRFQNPAYERRDEVAATLLSTASNISPGEHEYINPINQKLLTIVEGNETKQQTETTSQLEKKAEETQTLISITR